MEQKKTINKKLIAISAGLVEIVCIAVVVSIIVFSGNSGKKLAEQLDLAERYMEELDYEAAIAAYEAVIVIDQMCEEAYLGLAEAYVAIGENEKAIEILEEGYKETGSREIGEALTELKEYIEDLEGQENSGSIEMDDIEESNLFESVDGFVSWEDAGLEDHVMDWQDEKLEIAMREITGIETGDIMLSDVWELQELYLREKNITCIDELEELSNLQILSLYNNNVSDISALCKLTNLRSLTLGENKITDISALGHLINLEDLWLVQNNISDISALHNLTNLKNLYLENNNISDISVLSDLVNLQYLWLGSNNISDVSALSGLTNLENLHLDCNNISDISALSGLMNLQLLLLHSNNISDISALSSLTNLETLTIWDNNIDDYSPVAFVPDLSY